MNPPDDLHGWSKVATVAASLAAALAGVVWGDAKRRVEKIESGLATKADKSEMERQRDHVERLFEKLDEQGRRFEDGFRDLSETMHAQHAELLREVAKKVDR